MHNLIKLLVADEVWNISLYPLKEVQSHFKNTLSIIRQNVSQRAIVNLQMIVRNCIFEFIQNDTFW